MPFSLNGVPFGRREARPLSTNSVVRAIIGEITAPSQSCRSTEDIGGDDIIDPTTENLDGVFYVAT
jgi:hypothetical protein